MHDILYRLNLMCFYSEIILYVPQIVTYVLVEKEQN